MDAAILLLGLVAGLPCTIQCGETIHDTRENEPHVWLHGDAKWNSRGHRFLKQFVRWRHAGLFEHYRAVALADFDGIASPLYGWGGEGDGGRPPPPLFQEEPHR